MKNTILFILAIILIPIISFSQEVISGKSESTPKSR